MMYGCNGYRIITYFLFYFVALSSLQAQRQMLKGHIPALMAKAQRVSPMPESDQMNLVIGLPLRNQAALDSLLVQIYDPASPNYHHYITPEAFAERFGPSPADYQKLISYATKNGFTVTGKEADRTLLKVQAPVATVERAFQVKMMLYKHPVEKRNFFAPDKEPSLNLEIPVLHISGLDNATPVHSPIKSSAIAAPKQNTLKAPALLRPVDFRQSYAPGTTLTGAGQAVGIYNPTHGFLMSDIVAFENMANISPLVPVNIVDIPGTNAPPDGYSIEVTLDIEMAIAMAPGLSQVIIYQDNDCITALKRMATDNVAKQLTSSWPTPPQDGNATQIYKQFAAQGQTFFCASGDAGSYYPTQPFSATHPYITVVSGTRLTTDASGNRVSEIVWHDDFGSGGGGNMKNFPLPDWQKGINMSVNLGSTTYRNSPDVSMAAIDILTVLNGSVASLGGTSAAAPLWAGFTALVNERATQLGKKPVGFLNPSLYALGKSTSYNQYFFDVTSGDNLTPWNNEPNHEHLYFAGPGYDLCTGWGTPRGEKLIDALVTYGARLDDARLNQFTAERNGANTIEVFGLGTDQSAYLMGQSAPNGNWSAWASLGGHDLRQLSVGKNADGRLELFAIGGNKVIYHSWQSAPGQAWAPWVTLGGHDIEQIVLGNNADGRMELFALGGDKAVYRIAQTAPNGGWGAWGTLAGHDLRQISLGKNSDGRLEIFALGGDKAVYHINQVVPNGAWNTWTYLGGHDLQSITVANNADGRLELFALGGDKAVYHIYQSVPNGSFGNWTFLGGHDLRQIVVGKTGRGQLDLFALGGDKAVYHIAQVVPNGSFGNWSSLAGHDLQQLAVVNNADGRLEIMALGADNRIYHRWQNSAGSWSSWDLLH